MENQTQSYGASPATWDHRTQVNAPPVTPARQAGAQSTYPAPRVAENRVLKVICRGTTADRTFIYKSPINILECSIWPERADVDVAHASFGVIGLEVA